MHSDIHREKELMKWQCSTSVDVLTLELQMSRCGGKGPVERLGERQADSFVLIHYIHGGKMEGFPIFISTNWEHYSRCEVT